MKKAKAKPETKRLKAIKDYLAMRGLPFVRTHSGMLRNSYMSKRTGVTKQWCIKHNPTGCPDGFTFQGGRAFAIECKSNEGVQSEAQKEWQRILEAQGVRYILALSVDDVHCVLTGI